MTFDQAYYQRFYQDPTTRAVAPSEQKRLAAFIGAYLKYLQLPVDSVLDIGCGLGHLLNGVQRQFPKARADGVEFSSYLCEQYGWQQGSVVDYAGEPYDLVLCADVLGYLGAQDCRRAIKNLVHLTRGALYLSVLTEEDAAIVDTEHTDMEQHVRSFAWYDKQLRRHFVAVGGGLYLKKPLSVAVWRMEHA